MINEIPTRRRPRLRRLVAVSAAAVMAVGALGWAISPAGAVAGAALVSSSSASNSNNFKNATVRCPGDQRVYGAGYNVVDGNGRVAVNTLQPSADLRSVFVEANEIGGGQSTDWRLDAEAVCGPAVAGLRLVTAVEGPAVAAEQSVRVGCGVGEKMYGAGYLFPFGYGEVFLNLMEYSTAITSVAIRAAIDDDASLVWGVTGYGICGPPAATHVKVQPAIPATDSTSPKDATTPNCPAGTKLHGVGARIIGGTGDVVIDDLTASTAALARTKLKAYENDATTANWALRPQAICAS
jgi:hypothetical protein